MYVIVIKKYVLYFKAEDQLKKKLRLKAEVDQVAEKNKSVLIPNKILKVSLGK